MSIAHVAFAMYPVTDMKRAVAFYGDVLGLQKSGLDGDHWVEFDVAGTTFGVGDFEQVGKAGTAQSLALEVRDLGAYRAELVKRGVEVTEPHALANCTIALVRDPDGNQIWLHERKN
ncbi:MAG TPA: VOC family protein [Candidatus Eremiobacteraceae bacterium]|nr:VOC family protein [Candidatus Eremiobacteraceae bacterium]